MRASFIIFLLCCLTGESVRADEAAAREHFKKGQIGFETGDFDRAILEFKQSYEESPKAQTLFALGQAYRGKGELALALRQYQLYLAKAPNGSYKEKVEQAITEVEREMAENRATAPPHGVPSVSEPEPQAPKEPTSTNTPPTTPPVEPKPVPASPMISTPLPPPIVVKRSAQEPTRAAAGRAKKIAGIALLAVAGAALVGGIVAGVLASQAADAIHAEVQSGAPFDPSKESAGKTDNVVSGLMYGVLGAAAIAGSVLVYLGVRESRASKNLAVTPIVSPHVGGVFMSVRF